MAGSLNKVQLIGYLGRDPETRNLSDGSRVVHLSVATTDSWKDKTTGERKDRTEWHKIVIWNETIGEIAQQYLKKGSKIYLEGSLQTRKWTAQDGAEKYSTEIVIPKYRGSLLMLDSKQIDSSAHAKPSAEEFDDDIPF